MNRFLKERVQKLRYELASLFHAYKTHDDDHGSNDFTAMVLEIKSAYVHISSNNFDTTSHVVIVLQKPNQHIFVI